MAKNDKEEWLPDKTMFKDTMGRYKTQSLFLEIDYKPETAVYTLTDEDKEYQGKTYPSLRKLYLQAADPTEYNFAVKYLWGWDQWQKILENKMLYEEISKWRDELEVKLRAVGVRNIIGLAGEQFNAAKWVADGHWEVKRGRPTKAEKEREKKVRERAAKEATDDSARIVSLVRKSNG